MLKVYIILFCLNFAFFTASINHSVASSKKSSSFKISSDTLAPPGDCKKDSLLHLINNSGQKKQTKLYNQLSRLCVNQMNYKEAIEYGKKALELSAKTKNHFQQYQAEKNIGISYYLSSDFPNAQIYLKKAIGYKETQQQDTIHTDLSQYLGGCYYYTGQYHKAYQEFLQLYEHFKGKSDTANMANILSNIGNIYLNWKEYNKSLEYLERALKLNKQVNDRSGIASTYNNIANVHFANNNYKKTIEYNHKSLKIKEETGDSIGAATSYNNIAGVYFNQEDYHKALNSYNKALDIYKEYNDKKWMSMVYNNIGFTYEFLGQPSKALENYKIALKLGKETNYKDQLLFTYESLAEVYNSIGNYKKAFNYLRQYTDLNDSVFNEEKHKQMVEMEAKFRNKEKQKEIEILSKEAKIQDEKIKRKNIFIYAFVFIILLLLLLFFFIWRSFQVKKKSNILLKQQNDAIKEKNEELNQQREEIEAQRDEIEYQRDTVLQQKNKISEVFGEMNASIRYASTIQKALLPQKELIDQLFPENFIFFRPKESVSGDFYWFEGKGSLKVLAVVDCTGHGVPGAFLSVLGMTALNEIYHGNSELKASEFLNNLKQKVISALHQTESDKHPRDSMEMSICLIDTKNKTINFSGSYNPIFIIQNQELQEIKADRLPIGYHPILNKSFTNKYINYQEGDCLYMFTDGFADQKNHITGKKYLKSRFKRMLLEIHKLPAKEQKEQLAKNFEFWKGNSEQIDDVLIAGVRL